MKYTLSKLLLLILISICQATVSAQQVNTLYFMENVPVRHNLNPAFQPLTNFYLSLPVIGFTQLGIGNNSLALKDVIYNFNGQTITFLNANGDINRFYNTLKSTTVLRTDLQTNILSFGFRHEDAYWTFSVSEKINGMVSIPKDFFKISLYGTPLIRNNSYNFNTLQSDFTAYTEAALGYSKKLDEKITVGVKLKLLLGNANVSNYNGNANVNAGIDNWTLKANGSLNVSSPFQLQIANDIQSYTLNTKTKVSDWLKPYGVGSGIDLGVDYQLANNMKLSAALTDLGFIRWNRNVQNVNYNTNYVFDGVAQVNSTMTTTDLQELYDRLFTGNSLVDSLTRAIRSASNLTKSANAYTTATTAKLNLGFEYSILDNKLGFGLLSHSQFFKRTLTEELTTSANYRPTNWLNASLSYSLLEGRMSIIGAGLGLKTGIFHWLVSADYIPFYKSTLSLSNFGAAYPNIKIPIPYNSQSFDLAIGVNLVFDSFKRKSKDSENGDDEVLRDATKRDRSRSNSPRRNSASSGSVNSRNGLHHKKSNSDCNCDSD